MAYNSDELMICRYIVLLNRSVACFQTFQMKMLVIENNTNGPQNDINFLAQKNNFK